MIACLPEHLNYVWSRDPEFQAFFRSPKRDTAARYLQALRRIESRRLQFRGGTQEIAELHAAAARHLATLLSPIAERDCRRIPPPELWVPYARDPRNLAELERLAVAALQPLLLRALPRVRFYGGIKALAAIEAKVRHHHATGDGIDLLDCVRFRAVVPDVLAARYLCDLVWTVFGENVLRCRNYFVRPREGWSDPYRAVHFALLLNENSPTAIVELQVLSLAKDAVGLTDHALVHHRAVSYCGHSHHTWLRAFAYVANILDLERATQRRILC